jgi:hypothetical protein
MQVETKGATKVWPAIGLRAEVPPQVEAEVEIREYPPDTATAIVVRHLVNFEVVHKGTDDPVESFDPPMKITACYTQEDLDKVGGDPEKLDLSYWDKATPDWTVLEPKQKVSCPVEHGDCMGVVEVEISHQWGDPPVAWTKTPGP